MTLKSLKEDKKGLMEVVNIVLALVLIVIVGAIGIFIADTTATATGTPTQANLSNMSTNIYSAGQTGSDFIVILIIAFIGAVSIGYLMMMRKGT